MTAENVAPSFGKRYATNLLRWYLWVLFLGVGYHGGQFLALVLHAETATGVAIFITGVLGYALFGIIPAALIALIAAALPMVRILPTTIGGGILRVVIVGIALGVLSIYAKPSLYMPAARADAANVPSLACNDDNVEAQFQEVKALDDALGQSSAQPKSFVKQTNAIWSRELPCLESGSALSQEERSKYLAILIIGNADSVLVYFDAKQYAKARPHLDEYFAITQSINASAQAKGWTKFLTFEQRVAPLMKSYDEQLTKSGYPPTKQ